jgi:dihydroorotate dehydrogenase electron transfer subunit
MSTAIESENAPIRGRARVISNISDGSGRKLLLAIPGWPGAIPGQFLMIGAGAEAGVPRHDPLLPRPMAVFRDLGPDSVDGAVDGETAEERKVELLYRVVGRGTTLLSETLPGQSISVVGPLGRGFPIEADGGLAILVGGGSGIASLYELARALIQRGRAVLVILGARSKPDLLARSDFAALGVELLCTTEDGSDGIRGRVTEPLEARLSALDRAATAFAVGPTPMMKACAGLASSHSVKCFVSLENPMACGFGVCLGCAAPRASGGFALVCRDGPVFDAQEIDWEGLP